MSEQLAFEAILVHCLLWALDRDLLLTSVGAGWDLKGSLLDWKSWNVCLVYQWFTVMIKKSLKFLSDHSLLNRYIEVRSRLCREIKCPRLAELLQFLSKSEHKRGVHSNQCSHFKSQSFVDGCMCIDVVQRSILAPASHWSSITFLFQSIHPHRGADSAYIPGRKQGVT